MTTVVNFHHLGKDWASDPEYAYIGRRGRNFTGRFGNPIRLGMMCPVCDARHTNAGDTIKCFEVVLRDRLKSDPSFKKDFLLLKGKKLVCFCAPRPCHGDVIVRILDEPT